ncbi:MAG: TAT-variant-translocated molybdopterin oxidoreductase [Thermoanaerobaculia bacterium]
MSLVEDRPPRPADAPAEELDLGALRELSREGGGKRYWRSLEELSRTEGFESFLRREFPVALTEGYDRRDFLRVMAASLALAGVTACTQQPVEKIVPYVRAPEEFVPGRPLFYATALTLGGLAQGVLVESHMGRPTKVEGNPQHPASLGATDVFSQASLLTLYDPDRSRTLTQLGEIRPWTSFLSALRLALEEQRGRRGAGIRILTETVTSPTLARQLRDLLARFTETRGHQYEPVSRDAAREGARLAFGAPLSIQHRLEGADVILSLDADFLSCGPGHLRAVREFSARRRPDAAGGMNRLYAVESSPTNTGASADHRLPVRPSEVEAVARAIASALGAAPAGPPLGAPAAAWTAAVAADLKRSAGRSCVIAGEHGAPSVHWLAHAINGTLGNFGTTVIATDPVEADPVAQAESIAELARAMDAGRVEVLLILGGNPVFDAPADLDFAARMDPVKFRARLGLYDDETSRLCHWHVPEAHTLESWGDARAYDGTVTLQQPLIAPLYGGRSAHELLAAFTDQPERSGYQIVREHWQAQSPGQGAGGTARSSPEDDFEAFWRRSLHDGVVAGTALPARSVSVRTVAAAPAVPRPTAGEALEINLRPDPSIYDGRFANNGWLQELPRPLTKLTWDNALLVSPATAQRLGLQREDLVEISAGGRRVTAPVWIQPGQPDRCGTLHFGHGRRRAGRVGTGTGVDVYPLRTLGSLSTIAGAQLRRTGGRQPLACTQLHHSMEGRDIVRSRTLEELRRGDAHGEGAGHAASEELSLLPPYEYKGYAWGMAIDLAACVGCNACVVACQAENNIPVVGRKEVLRGREMHWIRVDRYYAGSADDPETYFQPLPCMHCERAPCEPVCPVGATVHSAEGLNDMVYNRCIGTRYCSNNCPYKVRRFNFFHYAKPLRQPPLQLLPNPDVTVRSRGVMEKCTYCVQRINAARIDAEREGRRVRDGEVQTACQQVCAARAITFGDINDRAATVAAWKKDARNYSLLAELGTVPRTTYLAAVRNPNPELAGPTRPGEHA